MPTLTPPRTLASQQGAECGGGNLKAPNGGTRIFLSSYKVVLLESNNYSLVPAYLFCWEWNDYSVVAAKQPRMFI
jgi:hypothetical protein